MKLAKNDEVLKFIIRNKTSYKINIGQSTQVEKINTKINLIIEFYHQALNRKLLVYRIMVPLCDNKQYFCFSTPVTYVCHVLFVNISFDSFRNNRIALGKVGVKRCLN